MPEVVHVGRDRITQPGQEELSPQDKVRAFDRGFALQNPLVPVGKKIRGEWPVEEGYDPISMENLEGYPKMEFVGSVSPEQSSYIKSQIDAERDARELVAKSGWGLLGEVSGAVTDPLNWLGVAIGPEYGIARMALAEAGAAGASELTLQKQQYERTMLESTLNVAGAGIVTGVLGTAIKGFETATVRLVERRAGNDLMKAADNEMVPESVVDSVGADRVRTETTLEQEGMAPIFGSVWLAEKMSIGPMARMLQSPSLIVRSIADRLADSSFIKKKYLSGISGGPSVEAEIRNITASIDLGTKEHLGAWVALNKRLAGEGKPKLKDTEFNEAVSSAMRSGDKSDIPEVEAMAQRWRQIQAPIEERAYKAGLFDDDLTKARKTIRKSYDRAFDARTKSVQKGSRKIAEAYFKAFQAKAGTAVRPARAGAPAATGAAAPDVAPVLNKKTRDALEVKIAEYIEKRGVDDIISPKAAKEMARDIARISKGIDMPQFRGMKPDEAAAARKAMEAETERVVAETFQELSDEYKKLADIYDFDPFFAGSGPGGRLSPDDFDGRLDDYFAGRMADDDPQLGPMKRAAENWKRRTADARGLPDTEGIDLPKAFSKRTIGAESYFPRLYNGDELLDNLDAFETDIMRYLIDEKGMDAEAAEIVSNNMARSVEQNVNAGRAAEISPTIDMVGVPGRMKERTVRIPDRVLEPYLISDPVKVWRDWSTDVGGRAAIVEQFGDYELSGLRREILDNYEELIQAAPDGAARKKLSKARRKDLKDVNALRDRMLGVYGRPQDAESAIVRVMQGYRLLNLMSMLGGAVLSSVTDIARMVQGHGFAPFVKGFSRLVRNSMSKLGNDELDQLGIALVSARNNRFAVMGEISDIQGFNMLQKGALSFLRYSGIVGWDRFVQKLAGYTALEGMSKRVGNFAKLTGEQKARWARSGISEEMAGKIGAQLKRHGNVLRNWTDDEARRVAKMALQSDVDNLVFKRNVSDSPLFMSTQLGKTILQFKSFVLAAHNRMLVGGLQLGDADYYMGMVMSTAIGAMVLYSKDSLRGRRPDLTEDKEVTRFVVESIGRTGWMGFYEPFKDMGLYATGNLPSRYAAQTVYGAALGPTPGQIERMVRITMEGMDGKFSYRTIMSTLPYNNPFHVRDFAETMIGGTERNR